MLLLFGAMTLLLGFIAGAIIWVLLKIINYGIYFLWDFVPEALFDAGGLSFVYILTICVIGAVLIGLFQRKNGILPDETEEVIEAIQKDGRYPYNNLKTICVAAVLPLIFGGVLGPEAGLVGIIAGLCFWVTESIKRRGDKLAAMLDGDVGQAVSEVGIAVVLGVIFGAPLFGIVNNLEPDSLAEKYRTRLASKKERIFLYIIGVAGGLLAFFALGKLAEVLNIDSGGGLPRFDSARLFTLADWKFFIPLLAAGIGGAFIYLIADKLTKLLAKKLGDRRILSCLIAAVCIAVGGFLLPYTMFSGEHQMVELMENWQSLSVAVLVLTAGVKLILVNVCVNLGWRGGAIFPIIFSGVALGYAMAMITGVEPSFGVAILVAAMYSYIARKPATVVAVLLLCFPLTYIVPIIVASVVSAKIPSPFVKKEKEIETTVKD